MPGRAVDRAHVMPVISLNSGWAKLHESILNPITLIIFTTLFLERGQQIYFYKRDGGPGKISAAS